MKKLVFLRAAVFLSGLDLANYTALNSTEAVMTFSHQVEFESFREPSLHEARLKIDSQLNHLFGPMSAARVKAVPRGNHSLSGIVVKKKEGSSDTFIASYSYRGTIVLQGLSGSSYVVPLPVNPDKIYEAAMTDGPDGKRHNPCTDSHYQSEGDFWYFWNPENPGCKLREGHDFRRVTTKVRREKNTTRTYPEYSRLIDNDGIIYISILMGMDDPNLEKNPDESSDLNARNFVGIRRALKSMGYSVRQMSQSEIESIAAVDAPVAYVEELTRKAKKAKIVAVSYTHLTLPTKA